MHGAGEEGGGRVGEGEGEGLGEGEGEELRVQGHVVRVVFLNLREGGREGGWGLGRVCARENRSVLRSTAMRLPMLSLPPSLPPRAPYLPHAVQLICLRHGPQQVRRANVGEEDMVFSVLGLSQLSG